MNPRVVDPTHFLLLGGYTDWGAVARRQGQQVGDYSIATHAMAQTPSRARIVQLRWLTSKEIGYPSRPFTVWRRPAGMPGTISKVPYQSAVVGFIGATVITLDSPRVFVTFSVTAPSDTVIQAYAGAPLTSQRVAIVAAKSGTPQVSMSATAIQSIILPNGVNLAGDILGLDDSVAEDPAWEEIETVGLPVDGSWAGIGGWGAMQGPVGAPMPPRDAAISRFHRGAPLVGWHPILPSGASAPAWQLADPIAMVDLLQSEMLEPLRQMVLSFAPHNHWHHVVDYTLSAASGSVPAVLHHKPLESLLYGAATDGLASLITGYGTAFPEQLFMDDRTSQIRTLHDYMVTATYDDGVGDIPGPVDIAAILYAPGALDGVPAPAVLKSEVFGRTTPKTPDAPWTAAIRVGWDALAPQLGVGSYAFARQPLTPSGPAVALMKPRPKDTAVQPLGLGMPTLSEARRFASDTTYEIDAGSAPNVVAYAVAHHDLFGQYSPWSAVTAEVQEPPVELVTLTSSRLDTTTAPSGGLCAAKLTFELAWNWAVRTPKALHFVGRLYAQAKLGDAPIDLTVPAGLASGLASTGVPLEVTFAPDGTASVTGVTPGLSASVRYLSADGRSVLSAPLTDPGTRRYKVEVTGFSLDFDSASRQGLALWGRGLESRAPQRVGNWSTHPVIASAADPRPPAITISHESVQLTSLGDHDGIHHAVLEWAPAPGAVGYFVYSCAEAKFNQDHGLEPPELSKTLEQRLSSLRDTFAGDPSRRSFARLNSTAVTETRVPITIPRGSKEIHLFVVLGISAGQIESPWPSARTAFDAWAAPQVVIPTAPQLEVRSVFDEGTSAFRAAVKVRTGPGATVTKVDLHRVRVPDAAVAVESMGPAVARIEGSAGGFTVAPRASAVRGEAQAIGTISGLDAVAGSWKRVFYRAVAWSGDDATRGLYGGRSEASAVRMVVVPPKDPPVIEAATFTPTSPGAAACTVTTSILAPLAETPLGPHRIRAEAIAWHPDGTSDVLMQYPAPSAADDPAADRLDRLGSAGGAGLVWHGSTVATLPGEPGRTPLTIDVPRAVAEDAVTVRLRLTDPIGRLTEKVLEIPAGVTATPPDILVPELAIVAGRGIVLRFETSVPDTSADGGPFVIRLLGVGRLKRPVTPRQRFEMNLADIPAASSKGGFRRGFGRPSGPTPESPVVRSAAHGNTAIAALFHPTITAVTVIVAAPDGSQATWRGTVRGE